MGQATARPGHRLAGVAIANLGPGDGQGQAWSSPVLLRLVFLRSGVLDVRGRGKCVYPMSFHSGDDGRLILPDVRCVAPPRRATAACPVGGLAILPFDLAQIVFVPILQGSHTNSDKVHGYRLQQQQQQQKGEKLTWIGWSPFT